MLKRMGYLITEDKKSSQKITELVNKSKKHGVPSYIFVNVLGDKTIVSIQVTDKKGNIVIPYEVKEGWTKYSNNSYKGNTKRKNAIIDINSPKVKFFDWKEDDLSPEGLKALNYIKDPNKFS
tara:strand:- start:326 stop:691 length:366 start_codon:yes stop_codon:yes gene_type:complete